MNRKSDPVPNYDGWTIFFGMYFFFSQQFSKMECAARIHQRSALVGDHDHKYTDAIC